MTAMHDNYSKQDALEYTEYITVYTQHISWYDGNMAIIRANSWNRKV